MMKNVPFGMEFEFNCPLKESIDIMFFDEGFSKHCTVEKIPICPENYIRPKCESKVFQSDLKMKNPHTSW